jgi:DNA-binding transcriptional MerR regulator
MVLKISDVCKKLGLSSRTLHVWEEAGLLTSTRDAAGVRCFDDDVFERIERIQILKEFGLSLGDIAALLSGKTPADVNELLNRRRDEIEAEAQRLAEARRRLVQVTELVAGPNIAAADCSELLVPPHEAKARALQRLLENRGLQSSTQHVAYLEQEFSTATPEETLALIAAFRRVARYAREHDIPLNLRPAQVSATSCQICLSHRRPRTSLWTRKILLNALGSKKGRDALGSAPSDGLLSSRGRLTSMCSPARSVGLG